MNAPGYFVVGMSVTDPEAVDHEKGERYVELAGKAIASVGAEIAILAQGSDDAIEVFAGSFEGQTLVLERYNTMAALRAFWDSPEYAEAKTIRRSFEGVDFHFIAIVEGVSEVADVPVAAYTVAFSEDTPDEACGHAIVEHARLEVLEGVLPYEGACSVRAHESLAEARRCASAAADRATFVAVLPAADPAVQPG